MGTRAGWLRLGLGLGVLALLIAFLGPADLARYLLAADPGWLATAGLAVALATLVGAVNLYLLLPAGERPPAWDFLGLFWLAWAVGLVVPGQVGDLGTLALGLRRRGYAWHRALGRSLLDKALSLAVLGALATWGLARWYGPGTAAMTLAALSGLGLALALAVSRLAGSLDNRLAPRARHWLEPARAALEDAYLTLGRVPGLVALNALLTLVKFGLTAVAYGCVLAAIGVHGLAPVDLLATVAASSLVAYVPITANGVGTAEATGVALFGGLGVAPAAVLSAYLLLRLLVLTLAWVPAGVWLALGRQPRG